MIIIAGPSRAGKSTVIDRMRSGKKTRLCGQLGMIDPPSWHYSTVNRLKGTPATTIDRLVLHYDLYANFSRRKNFSNLDALIFSAANTTALTLCTTAETLCERNALNIKRFANLLLLKKNPLKKTIAKIQLRMRKQRSYRDGASVQSLYTEWVDYISGHDLASHWLLDCNSDSADAIARAYDAASLEVLIGGTRA